MNKILFIVFFCLMSSASYAEEVTLQKRDAVQLIVGTYVNGFKEFDTSVLAVSDGVLVGIYFDISTQDKSRAEQLAERFREQIPLMWNRYKWAKDMKVIVNVNSWDITGQGYY